MLPLCILPPNPQGSVYDLGGYEGRMKFDTCEQLREACAMCPFNICGRRHCWELRKAFADPCGVD